MIDRTDTNINYFKQGFYHQQEIFGWVKNNYIHLFIILTQNVD